MSYIAQFLPLPPKLLKYEKGLLARILKVPPTAFSANDFFSLDKWTGIELPSLQAYSMAMLMRAAKFSIGGWAGEMRDLRNAAQGFNHGDTSISHLPKIQFPHFPRLFGIPFPFVYI